MAPQDFSDETLMAYADGALDDATARRVAAAAAADPAVARRIAVFAGTRQVLSQAAQARPLEPLSEALEARVQAALARAASPADNVLPLRRPVHPVTGWRPLAAAAGVALVLGLAGGYLLAPRARDAAPAGLGIAALADPGLVAALSAVPSGQRGAIAGGEFAAIASFTAADGALCREFEVDTPDRATLVAVACTTGAEWQPRFAVVAERADDTGYAPASSLDTLEAYLSGIGAGAPLAADEEARALAALSR